MRALIYVLAFATLAVTVPGSVGPQQRGAVCPGFTPYTRPAYDGRLTFVRLRYSGGLGFGRYERRGGGGAGWFHDYPTAECHFTRLLVNLTTLKAHTDDSHILDPDDPELFKHPFAYLSEPGYWEPTEREVVALRNYLKKGGFVVFDDFEGNHLYNLIRQMERVIPNMRLFKLEQDHPIFDTFYRVKSLTMYHPGEGTLSTFYGIFEDNDPAKRMLAVANHNNDIGDYWEWSDMGFNAIDQTNEAYKLGINYVIYTLSR